MGECKCCKKGKKEEKKWEEGGVCKMKEKEKASWEGKKEKKEKEKEKKEKKEKDKKEKKEKKEKKKKQKKQKKPKFKNPPVGYTPVPGEDHDDIQLKEPWWELRLDKRDTGDELEKEVEGMEAEQVEEVKQVEEVEGVEEVEEVEEFKEFEEVQTNKFFSTIFEAIRKFLHGR